jgi:hypothetical protein
MIGAVPPRQRREQCGGEQKVSESLLRSSAGTEFGHQEKNECTMKLSDHKGWMAMAATVLIGVVWR